MGKIIKITLFVFLIITALTAFLTLAGIGYLWFFNSSAELPYLEGLITSVVIEIVIVILFLAKKGLRYLPEVANNKTRFETQKFMRNFITLGTSATIVSNRVSWLSSDSDLVNLLKDKIKSGIKIEIITPKEVDNSLKEELIGCNFVVTNESLAPESRFTLINSERTGGEKLAIARGVHPEHEITIFDNNSGPQIIAMAKDIIRKSKEIQNERSME